MEVVEVQDENEQLKNTDDGWDREVSLLNKLVGRGFAFVLIALPFFMIIAILFSAQQGIATWPVIIGMLGTTCCGLLTAFAMWALTYMGLIMAGGITKWQAERKQQKDPGDLVG